MQWHVLSVILADVFRITKSVEDGRPVPILGSANRAILISNSEGSEDVETASTDEAAILKEEIPEFVDIWPFMNPAPIVTSTMSRSERVLVNGYRQNISGSDVLAAFHLTFLTIIIF